ncbi:MAG: PDZ domain-containing protein, partial [Bacteroidota bacterium]
QIDYKRQKIILHVPNSFKKPGKKYMQIPLDIYQGKPFITLNSTLQNNKNFPAKLLIDTGASLALLLYTKSHPSIEIPETVIESNIAMGLGGYVKGYLGRINNLELGDTDINNIITNFQERTEIQDSIIQSTYNRQGILGNRILDRFDVYIDYFREVAYIKPTRKFKKKFKYDRSGLLLIAGGENLTEYTAYQVVANSPAGEAGLKVGDEILKINGIPAFFFSLDGITKKLQKKPGKTIKLTVLRNGHKLKFEFKLRDLI